MTRALPYVFGLVIIAILVVVARVVLTSKDPPAGPVTAVWDHEACVFCRMHVGEPAFAAQLHTEDGDVWFFDDPGCLFEFLDRDAPKVHAMYFHQKDEDRWIDGKSVGFVEASPTPMGYGIAAMPCETPGAMSIDAARAKVRAMRESR
ncbi:MAG: hypothetical protein KDC95_22135 [Planctomycetes bacterium]|nr:hypothetical protein [Planctomycetota bacterium]